MDSALHRLPVLAETGIRKFYNGPESFTPDNQFILGEAPELAGFFVAAGFNSVGIASAGGAGLALAQWIIEGQPDADLTAVDIRRFAAFNGNSRWLRDRVSEVLGLHYAIPWPNRELETARPFRRSPAYALLARRGRVLRQQDGLGAGQLLRAAGRAGRRSSTRGASRTGSRGRRRSNWPSGSGWPCSTRPRSPSTWSAGEGAEAALQWLCTSDVAVEPGRTVYTGMLNDRGTYESDITVTRLSATEFLLVASAATTERDADHIRRRMPPGSLAAVTDVTSAYAVYGVMGPRSRELHRPAQPGRAGRPDVPVRNEQAHRSRVRDRAGDQDHLRG